MINYEIFYVFHKPKDETDQIFIKSFSTILCTALALNSKDVSGFQTMFIAVPQVCQEGTKYVDERPRGVCPRVRG